MLVDFYSYQKVKSFSFSLSQGCTKDIQVTFKSSKAVQLNREKILCSITKITFDRPVNEIPDWDDRMRSIKWVDSPTHASADGETQRTNRPARRKVVEADPEPNHQRIEDQTRTLDIYVSAITDYSRYKCSDFEIRYLDTAMLQTRVHEYEEKNEFDFLFKRIFFFFSRVTITNRGRVAFPYSWSVHMEDNQRPFTPMIDRDPPTPEPTDSTRKGQKGVTRAQSNAATTDPANAQENTGANAAGRTKDKTGKDAGKSTGKDAAAGSKAKATRPSIKSNVTVESLTEEKDQDGEPGLLTENTNLTDLAGRESESGIRSPQSAMTEIGYVPFTIEPDTGSIAVGASQVFKIKFAPLDVNDYQARLTCGLVDIERVRFF